MNVESFTCKPQEGSLPFAFFWTMEANKTESLANCLDRDGYGEEKCIVAFNQLIEEVGNTKS